MKLTLIIDIVASSGHVVIGGEYTHTSPCTPIYRDGLYLLHVFARIKIGKNSLAGDMPLHDVRVSTPLPLSLGRRCPLSHSYTVVVPTGFPPPQRSRDSLGEWLNDDGQTRASSSVITGTVPWMLHRAVP
jgi:hypothetical protein